MNNLSYFFFFHILKISDLGVGFNQCCHQVNETGYPEDLQNPGNIHVINLHKFECKEEKGTKFITCLQKPKLSNSLACLGVKKNSTL